ncbi:unnamed protein product [Blepharisma stoltei]|uniref:3-hydroxyisobutyryl-CoA hydrolase n=1 Tax=Blepharisma stoltei TaxID=1481888 RepID=A0AAU9JWR5_9CILI|nr:unnamed protein product [Blepharisma stoltei]
MLQTLSLLIDQVPNKNLIFQGCDSNCFSSGRDDKAIIENQAMVSEFYRTELCTIYQIYKQPTETLAILRGLSISAGNGIAMACKYRISTETTRFSMPENSIGKVPCAGASYFLTHLHNKPLGLFLMLSGKELDGNDLFWGGISTHYVPESQITNLLNDLKLSNSLIEVLDKYHQFPPREQSNLIRNLYEIEQVFGEVNTVEEILMKLCAKPTPFKEMVLLNICKNCPLSVKVAFKSFKLGLDMNYKEALEHDYNIEVQLGYRRSYNYKTAVTKKLIEKGEDEIKWYPDHVNQVTDKMVDIIIRNPEGPFLELR